MGKHFVRDKTNKYIKNDLVKLSFYLIIFWSILTKLMGYEISHKKII